MEDDEDDGYSSSGSSTRGPDDRVNETVPDSQPPRGGHILAPLLELPIHQLRLAIPSEVLRIEIKHV